MFEKNIETAQAAKVVVLTEGLTVEDFDSESFDESELFDNISSLDDFKADASEGRDVGAKVVVVADARRAAVFVTLLHFSSTH